MRLTLLNFAVLNLFYNLLWKNTHENRDKLVSQTQKWAKASWKTWIIIIHLNAKLTLSQ